MNEESVSVGLKALHFLVSSQGFPCFTGSGTVF